MALIEWACEAAVPETVWECAPADPADPDTAPDLLDSLQNAVKPMRTVLSTALYPVQWLVMQPIEATRQIGHYFELQTEAQTKAAKSQQQLAQQSARALQVDQLTLENQRLRTLLALRERITSEWVEAPPAR